MTAPPVTRLDNAVDSPAKCVQYDVYYNGVQQHDCLVADAEKGYIIKYLRYMGTIVCRNGKPSTRRLHGVVRIVPKGEDPTA